MQSTTERRMSLLEILCRRRKDSMINLANEFGVTVRTIQTDIEVLSCSYPIVTKQGKGGGVYIEKWFRFGMIYFTDEQVRFLTDIKDRLNDEEKRLMDTILEMYSKTGKGEKQKCAH